MTTIPLLREFAAIAATGALATVALYRIRLPAVAGLLLAGALVGPHGAGVVTDIHSIEILAELGVVLLLFTIGLEFSMARLRTIVGRVSVAGLLQVGLTAAATIAVALAFGRSLREGIFWGFCFALSSTAIVLRALSERRETDAPHGRILVGTLILQDLAVVPMVLIVPMLAPAGAEGGMLGPLALALLKSVGVVLFTMVVLKRLVPYAIRGVASAGSRDVFLLAVLGFCIGTAWLTGEAGLSLALGAFLAGIVLADSDYATRAMGEVLPLRDVFMSLFFVSVGMLFDIRVVLDQPLPVLAIFVAILAGKGLIASLAAVLLRFPPRAAWLAGVGLAQFGEFGFVLARLGLSHDVVQRETLDVVLAAGTLSMFVTPMLLRMAPHFTAGERLLAPLSRVLGTPGIEDATEIERVESHIVVVGYGVAGQIVTAALLSTGTPVVVLEVSVEAVREARRRNIPIYYADASSAEALHHAHLEKAAGLVVLINDPAAVARIVHTAREVAPSVPVVLRAHYLREAEPLFAAGANDVVADELESGLEVLARVLRMQGVPRNLIDDEIAAVRTATQMSARRNTMPRRVAGQTDDLDDLRFDSIQLPPDAWAVGRSLAQIDLRRKSSALAVAVRRGDVLLDHVDPHHALEAFDVLYLVGDGRAIRSACSLLTRGNPNPPSPTTAIHLAVQAPPSPPAG